MNAMQWRDRDWMLGPFYIAGPLRKARGLAKFLNGLLHRASADLLLLGSHLELCG
jgi:hypothetical protein